MAKNNLPLVWDARITVKLRSSTRTQIEQMEPQRPLTHVIRDVIDLYLALKAQNADSPAG